MLFRSRLEEVVGMTRVAPQATIHHASAAGGIAAERRELPVGETVLIELPKVSGELAFSCGMGMYRGMIVAR